MTPEREGRGPRMDQAGPALRFEKGAKVEPAEPKARGRPAGVWKKASARMVAESAVQPEAAPVREGAAPYVPDAPEASQPAGADTGPEAPPADGEPRQAEGGAAPDGGPAGLGQSVPKYRQRSKTEPASGQSAHRGKFRQDSQQARPSDRLHHDGGGSGSDPAGPATGGPGAGGGDPPEPEKLRKARQRMEHFDGKRGAAREKLAQQKPPKRPGPVKYAAGYAGRSVHGFVHGKIYQVEHENVGTEGAHRSELVGEAAGRRALRFTKNRLRTRPARQVKKAEGRYGKAAADFRFQQAAAENPDLGKNPLARMWRKRQQRKRYQRQAREAAKQGARAAEKTAVTAEKAGRAVVGFVKRHPVGVLIALLCLLLLVGMQSCTSSLAALGNGMAGSVAATTYPAQDADLLGAEAAYAGLEAELQAYLDDYEAAHDYDEYHFDLDSIEYDPYVLLSILSAFHPEGWTLADIQADLQSLFDRQYILTESVAVEVRYRAETRTAEDGSTYTVQVPYNYYICTVTLENFDLSHVPVYVMGEEQLSRYALYMAALGNRPDLFPGSAYIGRYDGPVTRYEIPPEALEDEQFAAMIAEAEKYLGYPYVWGGSSPATSFDCSGFVSWVVNHCGVGWNFGRLGAQGLYNVCAPVRSPRPGDLVFFRYTYNAPDPDGVTHCGIYVGDGMMIHCGDPISYANLNSSYWQSHFYAYGRLP